MQYLFIDNLFRSLSWTFVHSLWQGILLTIIAGLILLLTKRSRPAIRYAWLCFSFFLFLASVITTFFIEWNAGVETGAVALAIGNDPVIHSVASHSWWGEWVDRLNLVLNNYSSWIIFTWMIVLVYKSIRMALDMYYVHHLRHHHIVAAPEQWSHKLTMFAQQLGITRSVALVESALVKVPIVAGHFKPVILVPLGILTRLSAAEVEAVLLHELGHIRRHDYLVNFIQRIAEMLFFFNPGLLWVCSLLRIERENCCDDIAINTTRSKVDFVQALISFKEYSMQQPATSMGFFNKKNHLLQRVSRIVYNKNQVMSRPEVFFLALNFLFFVVLLSSPTQPVIKKKVVPALDTHAIGQWAVLSTASNKEMVSQPVNAAVIFQEVTKPVYTEARPARVNQSPDRSEHTLNKKIEEEKSAAETRTVYEKEIYTSYVSSMESYNQQHASNSKQEIDGSSNTNINKALVELDREKALKDRMQADKDRAQAAIDRKNAEMDRERAMRDRQRAELDRAQADKDRRQAEIDRAQAMKDREQAERDRAEAGRMRVALSVRKELAAAKNGPSNKDNNDNNQ